MKPIERVFCCRKVLLPVIHPEDRESMLRSVDTAVETGCRGVFLIAQNASPHWVVEVYRDIRRQHPELWVGFNPLVGLHLGLSWAYEFDGLWSDQAGLYEHPDGEITFRTAEYFSAIRHDRGWKGLYFGGVAFKYQRPIVRLEEAVRLAAPLMDVVCTSGPATGQPADLDKIERMAGALPETSSLALASGVDRDNVTRYLPAVDAFLVGTSIEKRWGVLDADKVWALNDIVLGSG